MANWKAVVNKYVFFGSLRLIANMVSRIARWFSYFKDRRHFAARMKSSMAHRGLVLRWRDNFPCLDDRTESTAFDAHYIYHTAWAARKIREIGPPKHVDISSSLYFCGIVSSFVPMDFYDFRPAPLFLSGLSTKGGDLLNLGIASGSVSSLSCMHVIEHVGLGRYGDQINPDGDLRAASELCRILATDGILYLAVPMAEESYIAFNAHRVYSYDDIMSLFPAMELLEFSLINDRVFQSGMIVNAEKKDLLGQRYACGCFQFRKR